MKNLITYLNALWRRGLDSQRKEVGVTLGEATIEHPFSTYSAPFGTCWQPSGKLHSVVKCAAMLVMLFTLGVGQMWAVDPTLTITRSSFSSTPTSYSTVTWSQNTSAGTSISGTSTTCFTNGNTDFQMKNGHPGVSNTTALPGAIKSVTMTRSSNGSNRSVTLYASTIAITSSNYSDATKVTNLGSKSVTTSGVTWSLSAAQISAGYKYFYLVGSSNALYVASIVVTYSEASCSSEITITKGSNPANGTFTINNSGIVCIDAGNASTTVTATPSTHYHLATVTSTGGGSVGAISNNTCTVSNISANTTINVTFAADPTYTVTWVAGSNPSFSTQTNYAGTALSDPGEPSAASYCPGGKVFVGWTATPIVGEGEEPADLFTSVSGKSIPVGGTTYYAVFATEGGSASVTKTDELTYTSFFAACSSSGSNTSGSYTNFSGKSGSESDAVYDGNLFKHGNGPSNCKDYIQMRTSSNSGIIATTSGGKAKKVTVEWNSGTANAKVVNIYGKNTAYSAISDLFSDATDGDLLGTITKGTSTELTITEDYEYIGIRSSDGAIYFDAISIDWQASGGYTYSNYATTCCTPLGTINGSVSLSQSGNSVTIKNWGYTPANTGDESYISKYTVYLYSNTDSYAASIDDEDCTVANRASTGVTFTGLDYSKTYKIKITATPSSGYCPIDDAWLSAIGGESATTFQLACEDAELSYGTGSVTKTYGASAFTNTLTNSHSVSVTYAASSVSPAGCISVNSSNGQVTINGAGSATITASSSQQTVSTVKYCADEASYTITVNKASISPTLSYSSTSLTVGDDSSSPTVEGNTGSGTVTYAVTAASPAGCVTVDASTGVVTAVAAGSATITATIAATANYSGNTATASFTVASASYFTNGATVFIQAESSSAWAESACVKAWFNASGAGGAAQTTYWLFDATGGDSGKKLFATVVPSTGDLNQVTLQRFASNCSDFWNNNGTLTKASDGGSNTFRTTGSGTSNVAWNGSGVTMELHGDPSGDEWASSLADVTDQGSGIWSGTYNNYAPANVAGTSQDFKIKTNYNGWIGNTGSNNNATLDGMKVGSTYDITATLDVTDHSLTMSKTFVKGEVSFDLQGHGSAISKLTNVAAGSKISAPSEPSAEGYTFGGWFTDAECTDEWTFASDVVEETMTLYAKWTTNVYTITKTLTNVANAGLPSSFTYTGAATTALNSTFTVNTTNFFLPSSITVTMGGTPLTAGTHYTYNNSTGAFTFSAVITGNIVITATATAKLKSIAITTQPTTRKYFAGESFSSAGAVVTATMGDGSTKAVTASATWTPSGALSAGTSQTVTASYTENGINQTATTTIDVYAVTMQATDENGDAIAVGGPGAPTRSIKSISPAADAANYVFKQWTISGASLGSSATTKSNTITSPTGAVTVTAVYYKPRVIKWSVNGDDSYDEGSPTLTVAYNGTITTVPSDPSGLACASTFVAWTDAAHNNGQTAKDDDSYYESKLFTDAGDFPNITAETTTFYAVFAEGGGAAVNTVMWSEDWTGATSSSGSGTPSPSDARPSAQGDHSGKTVYGGATITYADGTGTYVRTNENNAGGTAPELLIKANENWTISGIPTGGAATLTLEYRTNGTLTVSTSTDNVSIGTKSGSNPYTNTITVGSGVTSFNLSFTQTSNRRIDNVSVKVASVSLTNYVTECDANIVKVTYNANGGSTSCTNTTTDKTEDFTICSSAPTRDYYTFAGWLCSADSKTYAASATIDDAVIDADFTLTAQWTPVTYNITYELDGGTNNVGNPATYNVTTATITLQDPTKGHDRFDGWYDNGSFTGDAITSIPLGSHGDITLYAKWSERFEIIFDADGTKTTIYRAEDENMEDAVAGQGSVPSDPDAPTACSSKVFMGWSESTIDGETDTEPADLMNPAAGTVDENKHYYAVWADEHGESGTVTVFNDAFQSVTNNSDYQDNKASSDKYTTYKVYGTGTAGEARMSASSYAGSIDIDLSDKTLASTLTVTFKLKRYSTETGTVTLSCVDDGSTASFGSSPFSYPTGDDNWHDYSSTVTSVNAATQSIHFTSTSGKRVYIKDIVIKQTGTIYSYDKYATSCCATKVNLTHNSPEHGTITFGKTTVPTCDEDKDVSLTITPAAGYQLTGWTVNTASGYADAKSTSPAVVTNNNSNAAQNITLTFAEDANKDYDVTATFGEMVVTGWNWTMHEGGSAIPSRVDIYVGQSVRLDVAYIPSGVLSSHKVYVRTKDDKYINWPAGAQPSGYSTIVGKASTGDNTTDVVYTNSEGSLTETVKVKVLPLPLTHFEDLVHGKAFADVAATIVENALSATKNTPTSDDWTTPNANTCEENHLHLVGWIREDWPALVNYLNGTGDAPTTTAIVGAGNDGAGHAYYIAAGASINVQTFDGVTFYAVWAEIK